MSCVPTPVAVLTVISEDTFQACTISSLTSVSLDKRIVLFSLKKTSRTLLSIRSTGIFAINLLSAKQKNLSILFSSERSDKRLNQLDGNFEILEGKFLGIKGSSQIFSCRYQGELEVGDSVVIFTELIEKLSSSGLQPLIYFSREYHSPKLIIESE
jgi:flavin reductase (DIM6/NTAB) family NADH-FMN oxidoreductase RutF